MIEGSSRGKFPFLGFVKNLGIFGVLWGKFLFNFLGGLGQGSRESELSNVRMVPSQYSAKSSFVSLLGIYSGSEFGVVFFHGMEIP